MQISIDDRKFIGLVVLVLAIVFHRPLIATLLPFTVALALAALIEPLVNLVQTRVKAPRSVAATVGLFTLVLAGGSFSLIVMGKVLSELVEMGSLLTRYQNVPVELAARLIDELNKLNELFDQQGLPPSVQENLINTVDRMAETGVYWATRSINVVLNAASQIPALVVVTVIVLIATFFLVKDKERLVESALSLAPATMKERLKEAQSKITADLLGFFKAQAILFLLTTVVVAAGLTVIGVKYWMTLAIIAGILDMIPVLGPGFLFVPWAIGAITLGHGVLAVKLLVVYIISFFVRQVFQAKILGDSIGVHPLPMLIALYAGIHFFGLQGFIVAPILVIVVRALFTLRAQS